MSRRQPERQGLIRRVLSQQVTSVADAVMPVIVEAVDLDETLSRVDINELLEHVDLDAVVSRLDLQAVVERLDLNRLLDRVDLNLLLERIDLGQLVNRVDVEGIIDRVDLNAVIERVDLDAVIARVDINAIVKEVDVFSDVVSMTENLGSALARGTGGLFRSFIDLLRRHAAGLDTVVLRVVDHLLRRQPGSLPAGPAHLILTEAGSTPDKQVSGHYAGPVSRLLAFAFDILTILGLFAIATSVVSYLARLLAGYQLERKGTYGLWWTVALLVLGFVYFWLGPSISGRTAGMAVFGLRVVSNDGSPLKQSQSFVRVLVLPFSIALLGIGLVMAVVGRQREALHDHAAGTCVVYDWGDRPAEITTPLTRWLDRRGALETGAEADHMKGHGALPSQSIEGETITATQKPQPGG